MNNNADGKKKATLIVFSGDMDKVMASFILATGAASMGMEVTMFFTFWGLNVLKKETARKGGKGLLQRMMNLINRGGIEHLPLSKFNFAGAGSLMMKKMMKDSKIPSLPELMAMAKEMDVKFIACTMSMGVMGIAKETLIDDIDGFAGVATYLERADGGTVNLFI